MRVATLERLCCPDCRGALEMQEGAPREGQLSEGALRCTGCGRSFPVHDGVPVLLPRALPNALECELRKRASEEAGSQIDDWRPNYDRYHFRALAELGIERTLRGVKPARPRVLDLGIGWGPVYLPFADRIELWGIDFSLESLAVLRRIYERERAPLPELVCASLDAIPIRGMRFELVRSTQVYQHIPDRGAVERSVRQVVGELLAPGGRLVIENLNARYPALVARLARRHFEAEKRAEGYYLKYFAPHDFEELVRASAPTNRRSISYSEALFHPELRLRPRSRALARADRLLSRTPVARWLARQIRLEVEASAHGP